MSTGKRLSSSRRSRKRQNAWKLGLNPAVANNSEILHKTLFPPNPHRRKRIVEFCDKCDPAIGVRWYELLERGMRTKKDGDEFTAIQDEAPDFLAPYVELSHSALANGDHKEAFSIATFAYTLAVQRIADRNGDWPVIMQWAWFENRPLMRALHHYAWLLWKFEQPNHAAMILRRILHMNPGTTRASATSSSRSDWGCPIRRGMRHFLCRTVRCRTVHGTAEKSPTGLTARPRNSRRNSTGCSRSGRREDEFRRNEGE